MFIKKTIEAEMRGYNRQLENLQDEFVRNYIKTNLSWYISKAVKNKYYYYGLTSVTIFCPIISSGLFVLYPNNPTASILATVASTLSVGAAGLLQMLDVHKEWGIYRTQAEFIKKELALFNSKAGKEKRESELLEKICKSMSKTHEVWSKSFSDNR